MKEVNINYEIIAKYIKDNNLTVKQFCKKCDISYYSYLKLVKNTLTKFRPLLKIAVVIKVSMKDLLGY